MPLGTNAKQEIQTLISMLNGVAYASNAATASAKAFTSALAALAGGSKIARPFHTMINDLQMVANFAGLSRKEIEKFEVALKRLVATGKIPIQIGGVGAGTKGQQNITMMGAGGKTTPDYTRIFRAAGASEQIPGGEIAIKNITKALEGYRGSLKNLQSVHADVVTGTTRWTAQLESIPGIVREVNMVTGSMGQVIQSSARGFRSWGSAVARDISEFMKWSIAAAVIYVPMRKLNELFQESIAIQTKLADIQIAVGGSATITAKAYQEAADVAAALGVNLSGVMDGYVLAYRAAGSVVDPTQRASLATKLLADSMMLSRLSGMEQAAALDTLVGALRQLNMPLSEGAQLLDKWVAITKVANVDLKTLSESFAITATASENAGLSVDRLNAIIATVAETTILSSTEAGNAVRAFMSGFSRPEAEASLEKFGISVKDATGELKSFDQISRDIYERRQLGLIDDQAFARLSETLGGRGARRGAQVQAYLSNLPRVEQLATVSLNAHGDAADALNIQLETLQTALTRLGVAFSNLARSLGAEGGFLDLFKNITSLATGLINVFSGITKALGTATPGLLAFAAAMLLLKKNSFITGTLAMNPLELLGGQQVTKVSRLGTSLRYMEPPTGKISGAIAEKFGGTAAMNRPVGQTIGGFFGAGGGAMGGALTGLMMAAMSGALMGSKQDWGKTGAMVGGSIIGTIIAGGNPIGGVIGATIVTSLIDNLINREVDIASAFERIFTKATPATTTPEEQAKTKREQQTSQIYGLLGSFMGSRQEWRGRLAAGTAAQIGGKGVLGGKPSEQTIEDYTLILAGIASGRIKPAGAGERSIAAIFSPRLSAKDKEELGRLYDEMMEEGRKAAESAAGPSLPATMFGQMIAGTAQKYGGVAGAVYGGQKQTVTGQLGRGQAGVRDLQILLEQEAGFAGKVSTIYAALSANNKKLGISFKEVAELIINLSQDESTAILDTASALGTVINEMGKLTEAGNDDYVGRKQRLALLAEENRLQSLLTTQVTEAAAGQKYKAFEQPGYVEVAAGTTPAQAAKLIEEAKRLSKIKLESITMDPTEQQKIIDEWGKIALATVDAVSNEWRKLPGVWEGIDKELLAKAAETMGLLADSMKVSLETPDLQSNQFNQLKGNMEYYRKLLMSNPAGAALLSQEKPERMAILFTDPVVKELVGSRTLLSLALRDIIKNQEKQLEGIFNIPEGMTAMIPYTGKLFFSDQPIDKGGAAGILPELGPPVEEFTSSTGTFSGAVDKFAGLMSANPAFNKAMEAKMDRMEQEFERQWREANPAPTPRTDEEVYAAKEAEYASRFGGGQSRQEYLSGIKEATPETPQKYPWDIKDLITMGPSGEGVIDWIKNLFAQLGTLAETFSQNWGGGIGGATGGDVQKGLTEAGKQGLLPTTGPTLDTSGILEDLQYIFDSIRQGTMDLWEMFRQELGVAGSGTGTGGGKALASPTPYGRGGATSGAANVMTYIQPLSLPVTINTRIVNQTSILLDGVKIQQAINERQNTTLKTASRRAGTGGFIVEA